MKSARIRFGKLKTVLAIPTLILAGRQQAEADSLAGCRQRAVSLSLFGEWCPSPGAKTNTQRLYERTGWAPPFRAMLIGASMRLHAPELEVVNFATYRATVAPAEPLTAPLGLSFEHEPQGMWDMERYVSLLMGEVPRLTDDAAGYGPHGAGYIAHVDIPEEVQMAFTLLKEQFPHLIREANPAFAS